MARVREALQQPITRGRHKGKLYIDVVVEAYVKAMARGSFVHLKEYIDREEGKVAQRIASDDGDNIVLLPIKLDGDRDLDAGGAE
jgi:hypothetical protein